MRTTLPFNDGWHYAPTQLPETANDGQFETVTLPHTNMILPHHNFDDAEYQFTSTYRKRFMLPEAREGRRVYLDFEGANTAATVTINGYAFPEHRGGYTPFSYDITDYIEDEAENLLTVHLDSSERPDIPPFGGRVDYLAFGGIYREVALRYVAPCHIKDVFIKGHGLLHGDERVEMEVTIRNQTDQSQQVVAVGTLEYWRDEMAVIEVPPHGTATKNIISDLRALPKDGYLWSLDNPKLHNFNFRLFDMKGFNSMDEKRLDALTVRAGLREAVFTEDGFYLNGEKIKLVGLNRHQLYPYIGQAAPERLQKFDAETVKYELGCNIVRTSHYPQSRHFLDRCDEIGLLVVEEIPGWQHIGDTFWKQISVDNVGTMIERDRNRPSIVLWSVRINESQDDHQFYVATNALARRLDPTRQTTGVRFFQDSEFLEDVFGFNDFSNDVEQPQSTPHLITEFNGHMFPTKTWDNEERQMEHALRHARIQDTQFGRDDVTGAIGWCAFDYNTHKDFGSGDRICYHGVMDIFRLPKYAAYVYGSQIPPEQKVILQAATHWSAGDRSGGGNNPLVVLSNVDEIEIFIGSELIGRFKPDREAFPHLPHPPFVIPVEMVWGQSHGNLLLVGYRDDQPVIEQQIALDGVPQNLLLETAHNELKADGADMTWVWFRVVDAYGNRLPFSNTVITLEIEGPGELIGTNPFPLIGGQAGMFVKAGDTPGEVTIQASAPRLKPVQVQIQVT